VSQAQASDWFRITNESEVNSPSLLIFADRVEQNINKMIEIAGAARLRPHVKTHKMPAIIKMHLERGIKKFKCATIAESEMTAAAGAADVLLAYQPVGPNIRRLLELQRRFPSTRFAALVDNQRSAHELSSAASESNQQIELYLDIDCGQHRTGIPADENAATLYRKVSELPGLKAAGLHVYDGHINHESPEERAAALEAAVTPALKLKESLIASGLGVSETVMGGSPTFAIIAKRPDVQCSPGTTVLWDAVSNAKFPDLPFLNAALVFTRVVSKPRNGTICVDLGHKAVASEMPHPRVVFPQLPDAKFVVHSEEHLVIETSSADKLEIGSCLYGIPWHVCPTVALHSFGLVVRDSRSCESWEVAARTRKITI